MADITNCWTEVGLCGALPWKSTNTYQAGSLVNHAGRVWAAKTDIPTGQPAPGLIPGAWFALTGQVTYITDSKPTLTTDFAKNYGFTSHVFPDPKAVQPQTGDLIFSTSTGDICVVMRDSTGNYVDAAAMVFP